MKNIIKNDDAISVVVGAILILAVLVTFMSVVTSSWVPIYEGNAESDHSDTTHRTFMDLHKQIELADEFSNSATIDLGTDDISFVKNSYSVGYLEVNESGGDMFVTSNVTSIMSLSDAWATGFEIVNLNTSDPAPFEKLEYTFTQLPTKDISTAPAKAIRLNNNFMVKIWTTEMSRWITLHAGTLNTNGWYATTMGVRVLYGGNTQDELWMGESTDLDCDIITVYHPNISINLLSSEKIMLLIKPATLEINGTIYQANNASNLAPLHDIIQHYMSLPGDEGTGGNYHVDYVQYDGILDTHQIIEYNTTNESIPTVVNEDGRITTVLDGTKKLGGGTLKLQSDYNFMVDQSYIYDSGAVILQQDDGEVFKVNPPIVASNNSDGNLSLSLNSVVLKGDYQASGNGVETLYTTLVGDVQVVKGDTNRIMIVKETTPEYYEFWKPYFEDIKSFANGFTGINATLTNNTAQTNMTLIINDTSSTKNIDVSIKTKVIQIS